jgi:aspartate aminotransferase
MTKASPTKGSFTPSPMVQELARHSIRPLTKPGPELISLAQGDPDFATPEHISQALAEAVASGVTHYATPQGDPELRAALADQMQDVAQRPYGAEQVLISHGGSAGLAASIFAIVGPGTRVVVPEPSYSLYADLTWMAGGEVVYVPHRPDNHLDLDGIASAAAGARLLIICNPCNPTGAVYGRRELERLAEIARQHDLLVIADEAYDQLVFDGAQFTSALEVEGLVDRLLYVNTFSKTYAMTGWRIGWVAGPLEVVSAVTAVHRAFNAVVNSAVMRAALVAITEPTDAPQRMRREYQARRDIVIRMVANVPGLEMRRPDGAFYGLIRYQSTLSALEVVKLGFERGVAVRPGSEFGPSGEGHVRVAFSTGRDRLVEGMERLLGLLEEICTEA